MKKAHLALLVVSALMALSSAYSLAAINQVYPVDYEWYSLYEGRFSQGHRDTFGYAYEPDQEMQRAKFFAAGCREELGRLKESIGTGYEGLQSVDFDRYILLFCSLGAVNSPGYRVKVADIAQRGNNVEVRVFLSSPGKERTGGRNKAVYFPVDVVRVEKRSLGSQRKVNFIFKDQYGRRLASAPAGTEPKASNGTAAKASAGARA